MMNSCVTIKRNLLAAVDVSVAQQWHQIMATQKGSDPEKAHRNAENIWRISGDDAARKAHRFPRFSLSLSLSPPPPPPPPPRSSSSWKSKLPFSSIFISITLLYIPATAIVWAVSWYFVNSPLWLKMDRQQLPAGRRSWNPALMKHPHSTPKFPWIPVQNEPTSTTQSLPFQRLPSGSIFRSLPVNLLIDSNVSRFNHHFCHTMPLNRILYFSLFISFFFGKVGEGGSYQTQIKVNEIGHGTEYGLIDASALCYDDLSIDWCWCWRIIRLSFFSCLPPPPESSPHICLQLNPRIQSTNSLLLFSFFFWFSNFVS